MEDQILESEESKRFFGLVQMLQRSALISLGFLDHPNDGRILNLDEAREAIELLKVLEKRTRNNLNTVEDRLLKGIISELQMQFVQAPNRFQKKEDEEKLANELKSSFTNPSSASVEIAVDEDE